MPTQGRRNDYIPANAQMFSVFMRNLLDYVNQNKTAWGLPTPAVTNLLNLFDTFSDALEATNSPHTPAQTFARNEAQAAATQALRAFVNQYLRFAPVTDTDRVEMGVPNHDTIRTDHMVVTENVDYIVHLRAIREILIDFWVQGLHHRAKPRGYDGAVLIWGILDQRPASPDELTLHTMASRTPTSIFFEEEDRGKTVYIALAWQNERGIRGQWSEIKSAVIP